jgi:hypothetical protein
MATLIGIDDPFSFVDFNFVEPALKAGRIAGTDLFHATPVDTTENPRWRQASAAK